MSQSQADFKQQCGLCSCSVMAMKDLGIFLCVYTALTKNACQTQAEFFCASPCCSVCVLVVRGTQVCVITSVIRPGYGPPASKWTLYPIQRRWQQRRLALADYVFDDAARRLYFMGRYFWLRNNSQELFNLSRTMTCTISVWSHI